MSEAEARDYVLRHYDVPRGTAALLDRFVSSLKAENEKQNLISRASADTVWLRHIADSLQLIRFAPSEEANWLDLGSGAGFPGLIVSLFHAGPVALAEKRKLRCAYLEKAAGLLGIAEKTEILPGRVEQADGRHFDVISARAFAPLPRLFELGARFSTAKTRWILPKGRNAQSELDAALASWQGDFRLEPSLTDPEAKIVVAERVRRKRG